jgi:hypothetical protein
MKRFLLVMASLTIVTSSAITAVACQIEANPKVNLFVTENERNDLNNLLGAGFNQAKAMIIDNEFGIGQLASNNLINRQLASQAIPNFNAHDRGLNGQSRVGDVVSRYLLTNTTNHQELNSQNVKLGNGKGVISGLDSLIPDNLKETILPIKDFLLGLLEENSQYLEGQQVMSFFNQVYNDRFDDKLNALLTLLENNGLVNIKETVTGIKPFVPVMQTFFESFFRNDLFNDVRKIATDLLTADSEHYLIKNLYEQDENSQITPIGSIRVDRVKAELLLSIVRLLKLFYVIPEETDEAFSEIKNGSDDEISLVFANFLVNTFQNRS